MNKLALIIDIQTILKMVKFNSSFAVMFKKASFFNEHHKAIIDEYIKDTSVLSKETLWGILSTIDHIPEINFIIGLWRRNTDDFEKVEAAIELERESEYGLSVIGKIIEFNNIADKYRDLMLECKRQRFQFNGFKILPNGQNSYLQLFY
jgi:hypothetical protein